MMFTYRLYCNEWVPRSPDTVHTYIVYNSIVRSDTHIHTPSPPRQVLWLKALDQYWRYRAVKHTRCLWMGDTFRHKEACEETKGGIWLTMLMAEMCSHEKQSPLSMPLANFQSHNSHVTGEVTGLHPVSCFSFHFLEFHRKLHTQSMQPDIN